MYLRWLKNNKSTFLKELLYLKTVTTPEENLLKLSVTIQFTVLKNTLKLKSLHPLKASMEMQVYYTEVK